MAQKRVDTKFVIILASVLALVVSGAVGAVWWTKRAKSAPEYLLRRADEELAKDNYNAAIGFLYTAAKNSSQGADKIWMRYADTCYERSRGRSDLYLAAIEGWGSASTRDPSSLPAHEKRLRELYLAVREMTRPPLMYPSLPLPGNLTANDRIKLLRAAAGDYLVVDPNNSLAYACRGYANIMATAKSNDLKKDTAYVAARADLDKAISLAPDEFPAYLFLSDFEFERARLLLRGPTVREVEARALQDQAMARLQSFAEKHPNIAEASAEWGSRCIQLNRMDELLPRLTPAYNASPTDRRLGEVVATCLIQQQKFKEGEEILKKLAEANPTDSLATYRLAQHYEQFQKLAEAVACWQSMESPRPANMGKGFNAFSGAYMTALARQELPRMILRLTREEDPKTPASKAHLEQARALIDTLRGMSPNDPYVTLLSGRLLHMQRQIPAAIEKLKQADVIVSPEPARRSPAGLRNFILAKTYLAEAYRDVNDLGPAIKEYDAILKEFPTDVRTKVDRAKIRLTLGYADEVATDMRELLRRLPNFTEARFLLLRAEAMKGTPGAGTDILEGVPNEMARAVRAYLNEDWQGVIDTVEPVLAKTPENERAAHLAALSYTRLNRKDDARRILEDLVTRFPEKLEYRYSLNMLENPQLSRDELVRGVLEAIQDPYDRQLAWANYYRTQKNEAKELDALQAAEKIKPDNPELVEQLFTAIVRKGDFEGAQKYANKAAAMDLDGVQGRLFRGRLEMARGEKDKGLRTLQDAVAQWPEHATARQLLGYAYQELGQADRAIDELAKAIEIRPTNLPAIRNIIGLLRLRGDERRAQEYLAQGLRMAPNDKGLRDFDDQIGDLGAALTRRLAIRKAAPDNDENNESLARLYVRKGVTLARDPKMRDASQAAFESAIGLLLPLYDKRRDDLRFADYLAKIYRATGKMNEAFSMYQRFLTSPDAKVRDATKLSVARLHRAFGQTPEAVRLYEEAAAGPGGSSIALRELASLYFDTEDFTKAEAVYRKIQEKDGLGDPTVLRQMVLSNIQLKKFSEANKLIDQEILSKRPDDPDGLVLSGYSLLMEGNAAEATKKFAKVLAKNPRNSDALHYQAMSQFTLLGDLKQAATDLVTVKEINPSRVESRRLLARIYRLQRQNTAAVVEYRECLTMVPEASNVRLELAEYLADLAGALRRLPAEARDEQALDLRAAKPIEKLDELLSDSVKLFPRQPIWAIKYAEALSSNGQMQEATEVLRKCLAENPESAAADGALLAQLVKAKKYDDAIKLAGSILARIPDRADVYASRAAAYYATGKKTEAAADVDQCISHQRDMQQLMYFVQQMAQDTSAAFVSAVLDQRIQKQSTDMVARVALAGVKMGSGEFGAVASVLEPTLAQPALAGKARAFVLRTLGDAAYSAKNPTQALKYYNEAVALDPEDLGSLNNSAYLLADAQKPKEALVQAKKAVEVLQRRPIDTVYNTQGNVMDTYGWILFQNGEYKQAREVLERVSRTDPLPLTLYHLARTQEQLKLIADAKMTCTRARDMAVSRGDKETIPLTESLLERLNKLK